MKKMREDRPVGSEIKSAARTVYDCLVDMGRQASNPVLQMFSPGQALIEDRKYPDGMLKFTGDHWRAYYHCHPVSGHGRSGKHCFDNEHGHFHIFVRHHDGLDQWSHLVALSMDTLGQPQAWFTVNHWVTGESWCDADSLAGLISDIPYRIQDSVLKRWLLAMVALCHEQIVMLLVRRDQALGELGACNDQVREDHSIYLLSEDRIDMESQLETSLLADVDPNQLSVI